MQTTSCKHAEALLNTWSMLWIQSGLWILVANRVLKEDENSHANKAAKDFSGKMGNLPHQKGEIGRSAKKK